MNSIPDLVRESLAELTDAAAMPPGVGDRAMVAGRRRRRQRAALVGIAAVVTVAAVVLPFAVLRGGEAPAPATTEPRNVVFAVRHTEYLAPSAKESDVHRWEVLDPGTGDYRDAMVKVVSEPTNDLRYVAVLPKGDGDQVPRQVGRYETTTGALRWYDIPIQPDFVAISPDGRYAAARGWDEAAQAADIAVVDLETGQVRRFNTAHLYEPSPPPSSEAPEGSKPSLPRLALAMYDEKPVEVAWAPDSRHLLFGAAVTDLDGRRAGEVARPEETAVVSVHRERAGTLVRTGLASTDYSLVDATGAFRHGTATGDWTCVAPAVSVRCGKPWTTFLSWRGRDQILIQTGPDPYTQATTSSAAPAGGSPGEATYEALDLRTGDHVAVSVPKFDGDGADGDIAHSFVVVISAEGLSPAIRDRLAF